MCRPDQSPGPRGIVVPTVVAAAVATALVVAGCEQDASPTGSTAAGPPAATPAAPAVGATTAPAAPPGGARPPQDPRTITVAGLIAPKPVTWIWHPPENRMRAANYAVPGIDGSSQAQLVVFEGIGGGIDANIDRWAGQFRTADEQPVEPVVSSLEVAGARVTIVELEGEYQGMGASWFTPNQAFIAAIIEGPEGLSYLRLAGPRETVTAHRERFLDLIDGLRSADAPAEAADDDQASSTAFPESWYYKDRRTGRRYPVPATLEGRPAPRLAVRGWIGDPVDLGELEGKIVVVDFWATWCGPCMKSIPKNIKLFDERRDDDVVLIGVHDSRRGYDRMSQVAEAMSINYPIAVDDKGISQQAWKVSMWPTYAVIDHQGIVRAAGLEPSRVGDVVAQLVAERDG